MHLLSNTNEPVPLWLEFLEPEALDESKTAADNGNPIIMGVEIDRTTYRPIAYHVKVAKPDTNSFSQTDTRRIPASSMIHAFFRQRPYQVRGYPAFSATSDRLWQLDEYVDENTICVVAIAGQTFTGEDDDFQHIHDWLDTYEEKTGISIPMHIDAASGGFVNPFLYP